MRKILSLAIVGSFCAAAPAMACPKASNSSFTVQCENGVAVYRGTPLPSPARVLVIKTGGSEAAQITQQRLALQNERLAAQSERINALQADLANAQTQRRRKRYGTTYYGSPFLFGTGSSRFGARRALRRRVARRH